MFYQEYYLHALQMHCLCITTYFNLVSSSDYRKYVNNNLKKRRTLKWN